MIELNIAQAGQIIREHRLAHLRTEIYEVDGVDPTNGKMPIGSYVTVKLDGRRGRVRTYSCGKVVVRVPTANGYSIWNFKPEDLEVE